ncbi:hypothetical protein LX36DRAFT_47701 [Colletotrichum falcatum]|nr:hypothetical protein LX36DRAFT_47701 [Colletotrichum falcatum]
MVNSKIFCITGVSLSIPPWPDNVTLSASILLNPANVERFGQTLGSKNLQDRQYRVWVNLVVLFRLLTRCRHLAFDHDAFWAFIGHHWGIPNATPHMIEELADVYSERRRIYLQATHIKRKHFDLLTDFIDAWNLSNSCPSPPPPLSKEKIAAEWECVKASWLEYLRLDHKSLLDVCNPPRIGTFPVRKGTLSGFQIKGASARTPPGSGKDSLKRITGPSSDHHRISTATANGYTAESPTPEARKVAIDDPVQTENRKRRFASDTPSTAKRQCILESPPSCPTPGVEADSAPLEATRQERERSILTDMSISASSAATSICASPGPAEDVNQHDIEAQQAEKPLTFSDPPASCHGQHIGESSSPFSVSFDRWMEKSDKEVQILKEQTNLLLESQELSRDLQKAHDQLIMFTASKCQEALEKLDQLGNQVHVLGKDAVAFRQSGEVLQTWQTEQRNLIQGFQGHIAGVESALEETKKDIIAYENRRNHGEKELRQVVEARFSQLESKVESQASAKLQTAGGFEAELQILQGKTGGLEATVVPKRLKDRHESTEMIGSSHPLKVDFARRFTKIEETIATSTSLINNCRTLVEVSKTTIDQRLEMFTNRLNLLQNRLSNHIADQTKISMEQTKRLEQVEAELTRFKEAASYELQQKPNSLSRSEFADLQAQLDAMKKSLAVIEQRRGAHPTEEHSGAPLSPISQTAPNYSALLEQNVHLLSSRKHALSTMAIKREN